MAIRVSKIASVADDATHPLRIQPSELDPTTEPETPAQDDIWFAFSGEPPNRVLAIKVYDGGDWRTIADIKY